MAESAPAAEEAGWLELIAVMESELSALRGTLARGGDPEPDPAPWTPPAGLGPLPVSLEPRVSALLAEMDDAKLTVAGKRDEASRQLRAVAIVPRPAPGNSVYLDVTG
ncbi:hypothetical protein [Paeniglutamicibacter cryotolerans]|uniref:Uncharacterized protein n=1 Tax=Paeniglutamicibacter cryotolerans TaxID=670079 RepID=A0A839QL55_9MICC|nr:hypothetical protein [Paeniglutamicibacter cryotolerans]MBB2993902.1 hypothetical protein [Paeniglutamicibacter cryotolerans]